MAGKFDDLIGTLRSSFKLGIGGPRIKNDSNEVHVRNTDDDEFLNLVAEILKAADGQIDLGVEDALSLVRNAAQSAGLTIIFPDDKGTDGMVLAQKEGTDADVIELEWVSAGDTSFLAHVDTTTLAFNSTSPVTMFNLGEDDVVLKVQVIIDTSFDEEPSLSIGISGTTSKYMGANQIDLNAAPGTIFEVTPGLDAAGTGESLIATYSDDSASVGSARILVWYAEPK